MGVPYTFEESSYYLSSQVNANFAWLESIIGSDSTPNSMKLDGNIRIGTTHRSEISNVSGSNLLLAVNAEEQAVSGGGRSWQRSASGPVAILDIEQTTGFRFIITKENGGALNSQLTTAMQITQDSIYIPRNYHLQSTDEVNSVQDYRLTYVPLLEPAVVYEDRRFGGVKDTTRTAWNYGIPREAVMIRVLMQIETADMTSALYVQKAGDGVSLRHGTGVSAKSTVAIGEGDVVLGTDVYAGQFRDYTTGSLVSATLIIKGYWI